MGIPGRDWIPAEVPSPRELPQPQGRILTCICAIQAEQPQAITDEIQLPGSSQASHEAGSTHTGANTSQGLRTLRASVLLQIPPESLKTLPSNFPGDPNDPKVEAAGNHRSAISTTLGAFPAN